MCVGTCVCIRKPKVDVGNHSITDMASVTSQLAVETPISVFKGWHDMPTQHLSGFQRH